MRDGETQGWKKDEGMRAGFLVLLYFETEILQP
jgi:hypothetical protein